MTPATAKHRVYAWEDRSALADHSIIAFARDDDYFFGVLQSHLHEVWALRMGTQLESRPRYTPTTCFETFPLPWPPDTEPEDDPRYLAIAEAAKELNELREGYLNPAPVNGLALAPSELAKQTLTNLYNANPTWLQNANRELDEAVFAAYGWPSDLADTDVLARLLALNLERAAQSHD